MIYLYKNNNRFIIVMYTNRINVKKSFNSNLKFVKKVHQQVNYNIFHV